MNPRQRLVLLVGVVLVTVAALCPPWVFVDTYMVRGGTGDSERFAGYEFFFTPPPPEPPASEHKHLVIATSTRIDTRRLTVEWITITLVVAGLFFLIRLHGDCPKSPNDPVGTGMSDPDNLRVPSAPGKPIPKPPESSSASVPEFPKEPWEMTWPEYLTYRVAIDGYQAPPVEWGDLSKQRAQHQEAIKAALENGEPVASEVLNEYPAIMSVPRPKIDFETMRLAQRGGEILFSDKGVKDYGAWVAQMVELAGEDVRPYLPPVWDRLQALKGEEGVQVDDLVKKVLEYWKEYLPHRYQRLSHEGKLQASAEEAVAATKEAVATLISKGADQGSAWEAMWQVWMFPPSEEELREEADSSFLWSNDSDRLASE